jgi:hypothetical protein
MVISGEHWIFVVTQKDAMIGGCGFGSAEPVHSADRILVKAQQTTRNGHCRLSPNSAVRSYSTMKTPGSFSRASSSATTSGLAVRRLRP